MGSVTESEQEKRGDNGSEAPPPPPPSYDEAASSSQTRGSIAAAAAAVAATSTEQQQQPQSSNGPGGESTANAGAGVSTVRPTVASPFDFPPAYTPSASTSAAAPDYYSGNPPEEAFNNNNNNSTPTLLLAIPQMTPQATSAFLSAYSTPILLRRGIPCETFISFLGTISGFLSATVSARALAHVADMGRELGSVPVRVGRETATHAREVGRGIGVAARRGDVISAGVGAIVGAVTVPVAAALRVVEAAVNHIPAVVRGAAARPPLTPRERADVYLAVAQQDWFASRGLRVDIRDTHDLIKALRRQQQQRQEKGRGNNMTTTSTSASVNELVDMASGLYAEGAEAQLRALSTQFGLPALEIVEDRGDDQHIVALGAGVIKKPLDIGARTLWLVLTDDPNTGAANRE